MSIFAGRFLVFFLFLGTASAFATSGITYQGRLIKPNGIPVTSNVQFLLQIRTPGNEDCLLYEELQSQDLSTTSGVFALSLGDGSGVRQDSHALDWTLFESLANRKAFSFGSGECSIGNSYAPNPADNRKFRVFFNDGSQAPGAWEALPLQAINFVPMSAESLAVGGFNASSLLRVEQAGVLVNTAPLNNAQYVELLALLAGSSNQYTRDGELNGVALPSVGNNQSVRWNAGAWEAFVPLTSESDPTVQAFAKSALPICGAGTVLKSDGTSLSCVPDTGGWSAVDATATSKGIVVVPAGSGLSVTAGSLSLEDVGTAGAYYKVNTDAKGRVTSGSASLVEPDIPNLTTAGKVSGSAITSGTIAGSTAINTTGNIATTGTITSTGAMTAGTVSTGRISSSEHRVYDLDASPADNYVAIKVPASIGANYDMVLPGVQGTANQILGMNSAANGMEYKSITQGTGVTITHSAGGIQISATGSGGTVTSVSGTANEITVGGTASAPVIGLADLASPPSAGPHGSATQVPVITLDAKGRVTAVSTSTISGTSPVGAALAQANIWVGNGSNVATAVAVSGDAAMSNTGSLTVTGLRGNAVQSGTPSDGQVYRYDGSGSPMFKPAYLNVQDIRSIANNAVSVFPSSCTVSQTMTWSALTDTFACSNISVAHTQVTGLTAANIANTPAGTISSTTVQAAINELDGDMSSVNTNKVSKTGDTMTGALNLPANGLVAGTDQLVLSGGNVGIGTANPSKKLHVLDSSGGNVTPILVETNSAANVGFQAKNTVNSWNFTATSSGDLSLFDGNAAVRRMTILSNGNVGIGTSAPAAKLHVKNDTQIPLAIERNQSGTQSALWLYQPDMTDGNSLDISLRSDTVGTGATANVDFGAIRGVVSTHDHATRAGQWIFTTANGGSPTEKMRITASGNVGIGSNAPSSNLSVEQPSATLSSVTPAGLFSVRMQNGDPEWGLPKLNYALMIEDRAGGSNSGAALGFRSLNGLGASVSYRSNAATIGGSLEFNTSPDNSILNTQMTITSTGNVGIGITSPTAVLHLKPGAAAVGRAPLKLTSGVLLTTPESGAIEYDGTSLYYTDTGNTRRTLATTSGGSFTDVNNISNSSGDITLAPKTTTGAVKITSGTTSTNSTTGALVVSGGVGVSGDIFSGGTVNGTTLNGTTLNGTTVNATSFLYTPQIYGSSAASGNIKIDGTSNATKGNVLLASAGGNVGIGTTSPAVKLHISGDGQVYPRIQSTNDHAGLDIYSAPGKASHVRFFGEGLYKGTVGWDAVNDAMKLVYANGIESSNGISVKSTGDVGIGTTSPGATLDVNGSVLLSGPNRTLTIGSLGGNSALRFVGNYTSDVAYIQTGGGASGGGNLRFTKYNTTSTDMDSFDVYSSISSFTGNVGIGTASPSAKLDVRGDIKVNGRVISAYSPNATFDLGGQDWSKLIRYGSTTYNYSSVDMGVKIVNSGAIILSTRIPVDPLAVYRAEVTFKKLSGSGGVYVGADSLDDNFAQITTDTASSYNYFGASNDPLAVGSEKTYVGYISGYNPAAPAAGVHTKFDPGAKYFDLVLIGNYGGSGETVVKGVHISKVEGIYTDSTGNVGIGTTTPATKLHVAGEVRATNFSDGSGANNVNLANSYSEGRGVVAGASGNAYSGIGYNIRHTGTGASYILPLSDTSSYLRFDQGGFTFMGEGMGAIDRTANYTTYMNILSNGNVGIGTTIPSQRLHVVGNLRVQGSTDCTLGNGAGGTNCSSDIRLKTNIQEIENPLEKILSLRGVEFDWNEKSQDPGHHAIGVIAQDVEKQFPTAVIEDSETGYKKVDYAVLVAPIISAFKELNKRLTDLLSTTDGHSRDIASIHARISKLESENTELKASDAAKEQRIKDLEKRLERIEHRLQSQ